MDNPIAGLAERVRAICLALPEVTERLSHGAPTWYWAIAPPRLLARLDS